MANSVCVTGKFVNPSACDGLLKNFYFMASFYGWGPTASRLEEATLRRQFTFDH